MTGLSKRIKSPVVQRQPNEMLSLLHRERLNLHKAKNKPRVKIFINIHLVVMPWNTNTAFNQLLQSYLSYQSLKEPIQATHIFSSLSSLYVSPACQWTPQTISFASSACFIFSILHDLTVLINSPLWFHKWQDYPYSASDTPRHPRTGYFSALFVSPFKTCISFSSRIRLRVFFFLAGFKQAA